MFVIFDFVAVFSYLFVFEKLKPIGTITIEFMEYPAVVTFLLILVNYLSLALSWLLHTFNCYIDVVVTSCQALFRKILLTIFRQIGPL